MRTQLISTDCPVKFQEKLNLEIRSIGSKFKILEIKFSTCSTGDPMEFEAMYSALIVYQIPFDTECR